MKRYLTLILLAAFFIFGAQDGIEAKTKSLQEVEGNRVIALKIDKKAKLPKKFLKRNEAQANIGSMDDLKNKVTGNLYTGENVIRHEKSPRFLNISDGIIFNTGGGKIGYVSRKDGAYTMILDYPEGRKLEVVDEALFDKYSNVINDDCTVPYVFFDKVGNEAAIVYLPKSMLVYQYITVDGSVAIEVFEQI